MQDNSSEMFRSLILSLGILSLRPVYTQEVTSDTLTNFVRQFTNLIGENGGLAALVNSIPHGPPGKPYPLRYPDDQGYPSDQDGGYYGYAPDYPYEDPRPARPYRPGYRPPYRPPYRPRPEYYPPDNALPGSYPPYRPYPQLGSPGSYPPALPPGYKPQQSFMGALASIARYDDLRCVPRLLCEVTSGGKPGYPSYTQGQQTTRDTITTLLTVLNFVDDNPLLIFGRAALLGAAARGNSAACLNAYPTCPRDPDQLVTYLNNHNGGFFRFFGGLPGGLGTGRGKETGESGGDGSSSGDDVQPASGEGRIQNRPGVRYPRLQENEVRPAQGTAFLPSSAVGSDSVNFADTSGHYSSNPGLYSPSFGTGSGSFVFPNSDDDNRRPPSGHRGGKQLTFPQDEKRPVYSNPVALQYRPDFSPPNNFVNFRDQRSVKFPSSMSFPKE